MTSHGAPAAEQTRVFGVLVPVTTAEDLVLFKLASWRAKDIPDVLAVRRRQGDRLDLPYLRKWADWLAATNRCFAAVPERLDAVLAGRPLPPPSDV